MFKLKKELMSVFLYKFFVNQQILKEKNWTAWIWAWTNESRDSSAPPVQFVNRLDSWNTQILEVFSMFIPRAFFDTTIFFRLFLNGLSVLQSVFFSKQKSSFSTQIGENWRWDGPPPQHWLSTFHPHLSPGTSHSRSEFKRSEAFGITGFQNDHFWFCG